MSIAKNLTCSPTTNASFPPAPSEIHQDAGTVAIKLRNRDRVGLGTTPYRYLPLFARVAIERLDADNALRTEKTLDGLMQAYAGTYGQLVDMETCAAAHHICRRRFWDFSTDVLAATSAGVPA